MIRNDVDDFRAAFFDRVIQDEQRRARELQRKQAHCFHQYVPVKELQHAHASLGPITFPFVALQCARCQHIRVCHHKKT